MAPDDPRPSMAEGERLMEKAFEFLEIAKDFGIEDEETLRACLEIARSLLGCAAIRRAAGKILAEELFHASRSDADSLTLPIKFPAGTIDPETGEFQPFPGTEEEERSDEVRCVHDFRGSACRYVGTEWTCSKLFDGPDGCREKGNEVNFGGFPLVPKPVEEQADNRTGTGPDDLEDVELKKENPEEEMKP